MSRSQRVNGVGTNRKNTIYRLMKTLEGFNTHGYFLSRNKVVPILMGRGGDLLEANTVLL